MGFSNDGETCLTEQFYYRYVIRPRYLRNVSQVDMKVTLFGDEITFPIGVCPTSPFSAKSHEGGCVFVCMCMMCVHVRVHQYTCHSYLNIYFMRNREPVFTELSVTYTHH